MVAISRLRQRTAWFGFCCCCVYRCCCCGTVSAAPHSTTLLVLHGPRTRKKHHDDYLCRVVGDIQLPSVWSPMDCSMVAAVAVAVVVALVVLVRQGVGGQGEREDGTASAATWHRCFPWKAKKPPSCQRKPFEDDSNTNAVETRE